MSLYHFHVTQVSRGKGHTAIAAAAYRSGQKLYDEYYGETQDYTRKGGVVVSEILLPPNAPGRYRDRQTLWTELEQAERHPKAQLAYSFDIALQNELTMEENIALARQFVLDNFVARGMVCDFAVHMPDKGGGVAPNPHFHVLAPIRPLDENGKWGAKQHREYRLDRDGNRIRKKDGSYEFDSVPDTDWGKPETLEEWRRNWADLVNSRFSEKGLDARIDHRSYKEQESDQIPQVHEGAAVRHMEQKGKRTDIGDWNRWIRRTNAAMKKIVGTIRELSEWIGQAVQELQKKPEPTVVELVSEYFDQRDAVADTYERGRQKAKITNLKYRANVCGYLMENHVVTMEDLEGLIADRRARAEKIGESMKPRNAELRELQARIRLAADYQKHRPVFEASQKIFFKKKKAAYQEEHRKELNTFQRARRELQKLVPDGDIQKAEKTWKAQAERLAKEIAEAYEREGKDQLESEIRSLVKIRKAVDAGLARRQAESGSSGGREAVEQRREPAKTQKMEDGSLRKNQGRASLKERLRQKQEEAGNRTQNTQIRGENLQNRGTHEL